LPCHGQHASDSPKPVDSLGDQRQLEAVARRPGYAALAARADQQHAWFSPGTTAACMATTHQSKPIERQPLPGLPCYCTGSFSTWLLLGSATVTYTLPAESTATLPPPPLGPVNGSTVGADEPAGSFSTRLSPYSVT
jgi:hypothetical protein